LTEERRSADGMLGKGLRHLVDREGQALEAATR
jgi:hypothetical protein